MVVHEIKMKTYPDVVQYYPINPEKYVGNIKDISMRSSWEVKFARWADTNPSILKWGSEIIPIPYRFSVDGKTHRYYPDFWMLLKNTKGEIKKYIVEIKPLCQVNKPRMTRGKKRDTYMKECVEWIKNQEKWGSAVEYAKRNGFEFVVLTEKELGV